jgi:nicotinamidase-related amidase
MRSALLLIDVQKIYTTEGSPLLIDGHELAIDNMNKLIDRATKTGDLVVYVKHIHKKDGSDAGRMFDFLGEPGEIGFVEGTDEASYSTPIYMAMDFNWLTES